MLYLYGAIWETGNDIYKTFCFSHILVMVIAICFISAGLDGIVIAYFTLGCMLKIADLQPHNASVVSLYFTTLRVVSL